MALPRVEIAGVLAVEVYSTLSGGTTKDYEMTHAKVGKGAMAAAYALMAKVWLNWQLAQPRSSARQGIGFLTYS
jgi:hypothetical protein